MTRKLSQRFYFKKKFFKIVLWTWAPSPALSDFGQNHFTFLGLSFFLFKQTTTTKRSGSLSSKISWNMVKWEISSLAFSPSPNAPGVHMWEFVLFELLFLGPEVLRTLFVFPHFLQGDAWGDVLLRPETLLGNWVWFSLNTWGSQTVTPDQRHQHHLGTC